jgi:hypothetical protein
MNKALPILKKASKAILWMVFIFVLLFLVIAVIIQIPSVQNKIIHYVTTLVSDKTHTRVEIKNVSISFPEAVVFEKLYLDDLKRDTLVYAERIKVSISLYDLMFSKITVKYLAVRDLTLNLHNTKTDSLFNYKFLITSFTDTIKKDTVKAKKTSGWTFAINKVNLKNIRLRYDDEYGGINISSSLGNLKLKIDQLNFSKSIYQFNNLLVENLNTKIQISKPAKESTKTAGITFPIFTVNKVQINNSTFRYKNAISKEAILAAINNFGLEDGLVDLGKEEVIVSKVYLSESKIKFSSHSTTTNSNSLTTKSASSKKAWKVNVLYIDFNNNLFSYQTGNKPKAKKIFDVSYLNYKQVTLIAQNLYYSTYLTKVSINKFSAIDENNFAVTGLETDFRMDRHSITAKNLKVGTKESSIDADINIRYNSLRSLKESFPSLILNLNLKKISINSSDVLYFTPKLALLAFFKNRTNTTTISGQITGKVNDLRGKNLLVRTGEKTILKTDFVIVGLPNIQSAYFVFPRMKLITNKHDVNLIAGSSLSTVVNLPQDITLLINFKGKINSFISTMDINCSYGRGKLLAQIDSNDKFRGNLNLVNFDAGNLLKKKDLLGSVSLTAQVSGQGFDPQTMKAQIKANVSHIYLNKYLYHNLLVDGTASDHRFVGKINLNDKNAVFCLDGLVNITPNQEHYKFHMNVQGANLQKLNLSKNDLRIGFDAVSDLKGSNIGKLNGEAKISNLMLVYNSKKYVLDSVFVAAINEPNKNIFNFNSPLIDMKYNGTLSPTALPTVLTQFINNYFPFFNTAQNKKEKKVSKFNFEIQLHNHPILSEVLLPQLKVFQPGIIKGSFDSQKKELKLNGVMTRIVYGTTDMKNLVMDVHSDSTILNYIISCSGITSPQISLSNLLFKGSLADKKMMANISSIDEKKNKKLSINSQITKDKDNYKLVLDSTDFYLMNNRWNIAADNYIEFGKSGFLIHNLFISNAQRQVNIASVNNKFNDDLKIAIKDFKLEDISQIIEKDSSLARGDVNGNILLKRVSKSYGIIADAQITNLFIRNIPIGNLTVKAVNPTTKQFNINVKLVGTDNNLTASGYFMPKDSINSLNIKADIQSLSMKTIEAFSMGQITETSGNVSGKLFIIGKTNAPQVTGTFTFNNVFLKPAYFNNRYEIKHETVQLQTDGIYLNSFTIFDSSQHSAIIDGIVKMKHFSDYNFNLHVKTKDFLLFNTSAKDNKEFYGRMIIDSNVGINGPLALPVINAKINLKKGSNFTFAVPEDKITTDKGEDVVEFNDTLNRNSILYRSDKKVIKKSTFTGIDLSSIIQIDKEATLRLLIDPTSSDSLVVRGDAALSFMMDKSGKMSLTGTYNLNSGVYLISIESVIKRKFEIISGSTITWNGDPLDANVSINASYTVKAAPYDLVADQMSGLSEAEKNGYKQVYPFLVILKLRGALLKPEISFEIQLLPEDKGIMSGAVNQKLSMLNDDPSLLNKQVFALLVLGRFIQENPLQTAETAQASTLVRSTISTFLSAQINELSSKVLPGISLNFDVQSYNDYQSGQAQGRTQVEIGLKKQMFNERFTLQIGGTVDVEGAKAKQNSASEITSDVTVEYKATKDGRYRLKAFRHNLYDGAIEGEIVETGLGVIYVRDFNTWRMLFKANRKKMNPSKEISTKGLTKKK